MSAELMTADLELPNWELSSSTDVMTTFGFATTGMAAL